MSRLAFVLLFLLAARVASAQIYPIQFRPQDLNWQQLKTPHFRIVFPQGEDSVALRTARMLEHEYSEIQHLVGGELQAFPVVLNNNNDLSNGFVTTLHFRSEIEIPTIKGKAMNPQSGNWLETVAPHELVHALHDSHVSGFFANLVSLFSPDFARSLHGAVPFGIHEGIATYHETAGVAPDGGRGNYPFFYNQFNSVFNSAGRWSLGQMLAPPSFSRPFDRHYQGGFEFTSWLHDNYGEDITRRTIDLYIRRPFLGYGFALKHTTGLWPGQLYNRFEDDFSSNIKRSSSTTYETLLLPYKGREIRRPLWFSGDQLIVHGSFYNARPGFYRYNLDDHSFHLIAETRTVGDFIFDLSADRSTLIFSNYLPDSIYDNTFTSELYEIDLFSGQSRRFSRDIRAHAPVFHRNSILALQTDHESNRLISFSPSSSSSPRVIIPSLPNTEFVHVRPNPSGSSQLAVVANRRGLQGLWLVKDKTMEKELRNPPDISFMGGSIFDPFWHPSGNRLLFSSDHTGTMQLYEYDLAADSVLQLTGTAYNAMEASYSPDGSRIAFVVQQKNERLLAVTDRDSLNHRPVSSSVWRLSKEKTSFLSRPELGASLTERSQDWPFSSYSSGLSWLKPRTVLPIFEEISNSGSTRFGLGLHSSDLLQQNSYQVDLSFFENRLWYDLVYKHSGFFPGFEINAFSDPALPALGFVFPDGSRQVQRLLRQSQGVSLGLPFRFVLENNSRFSSFIFSPIIELRRTRFWERNHDGSPASDFAHSVSGNFFVAFNHRLQQNIRDVQPNSGIILFSEVEHFLNSTSLTINTLGERFLVPFNEPTGWRSGLFLFSSPLRRWNQSLRIGVQGLSQSSFVFDNQDLVSDGFSEPVFPEANNLISFSTRYTIPLVFPDNGGFLLPAYLGNLYLVGFSNTISDVGRNSIADFFSASRSIFGIGLRSRFRLSNLSFDLGVAFAIEPTRDNTNFFVGNF